MANRKITLKRNNSGTVEPLYPTTTSDQIFTADGLTSIFSNDKITYAALPDGVKYGLKFQGTVALSSTAVSVDTLTAFSSLSQDNIGKYVIVSTAGKLTGKFTGASGFVGDVTYKVFGEEGEYETGSDATTEVINLEKGDWIVFTKIEEDSSDPVNTVYSFSVINNTYGEATTSAPGIMSSADKTKLDGIAASADNYNGFNVTDGSTSTTIVSGGNLTFTASGAASVSESSGTITIGATNTTYTIAAVDHATDTSSKLIRLSDGSTNDDVRLTGGTNVTISRSGEQLIFASTDTVYTHPSYTERSVDTDGVDVLDTFTSDAEGHITAITTRTLPNATTSAAGVMSAADKTKHDAMNVVQYAAALDTVATYGFIYFDED